MEIKDILRRLLLARGVEIAEVARAAGVSRQSLTNIVSGKTARPQNATVQKLAIYFDVSPEYLLYGEDEAPVNDLANLRAEVAELKKRLNGPQLRSVVVDQYQRERLLKKYFKGGGVLVLELANAPDKVVDEFLKLLFVYDEVLRRTEANDKQGKNGD